MSRVYLGQDLAALPDLLTDLRYPLYIAHRGGPQRYPEHSIEAYRAAADDGFAVEPDLDALADGSIVCLHDSTVDRTMTGTGAASSLTRAQWEALRIKAPFAPLGGGRGTPCYWLDVLREFGGRCLLVPEIKNASIAPAVIESIASRGLYRAVIVQSFSYSVAQAAAARGIAAMYLSDAVGTGGGNPTAAQVLASGIGFLGCSTSASSAYIAAAKAAGLKVIAYTVNTKAATTTAITTNGADGVFTDDPWFITDRLPPADTDPWASKRGWPGGQLMNGVSGGLTHFRTDMMGGDVGAGASAGFNHNWAGVRTSTGRVRVAARVHFLPSANTDTSRWISIWIGTFETDGTFTDGGSGTASEAGYHFLFRRTGTMDVYAKAAGAGAGSIATVAGTSIASTAEGAWDVEITIDATNVTVKNLTTGVSATAANTTYRQAARLATVVNGTHAYLSRMSVSDLS